MFRRVLAHGGEAETGTHWYNILYLWGGRSSIGSVEDESSPSRGHTHRDELVSSGIRSLGAPDWL